MLATIRSEDIVRLLAMLLHTKPYPHGQALYPWMRRETPEGVSSAHLLGDQPKWRTSLRRAEAAGLYSSFIQQVNRQNLLDFLLHGVRYAFPNRYASRPDTFGVPTSGSSSAMSQYFIPSGPRVVWPVQGGPIYGRPLSPLIDNAAEIMEAIPELYRLLSWIDAIRIGSAREREIASDLLRRELQQ